MSESDESLRAKVDQAMIYAPPAWLAQATRIAEAYAAAYEYQRTTLKQIEEQIRQERELALAMLNLILPSFIGGAVGAVFAGKGRELVDGLATAGAKFWGTAAVDTGKTIISDAYKSVTRLALDKYVVPVASSWEPSAISPAEFLASVQGAIYVYITAVKDGLNRSKLGKTLPITHRQYLESVYYGPFIRFAPESEELWPKYQLTKAMEIFLWAHWAHRRDTKYWLKNIGYASESGITAAGIIPEARASQELQRLDPILERLKICGVPESYVTQPNKDIGGRFLNILWVRHLDQKYPGTLLGTLLSGLKSGSMGLSDPLPPPRGVRLM